MALRYALRRASTMAFASGSSSRASMLDAAAEAYAAAAAALPGQPDLVVLFQSGVGSSVGDADAIAELLPPETHLIGHSAAGGREPRTQVLAGVLPRVRLRPFSVCEPTLPEEVLLDELKPGADPVNVLLLAASGFRVGPLSAVLDAAFPTGMKVGAAELPVGVAEPASASSVEASGGAPAAISGGGVLLGGRGVRTDGAVGMLLSGDVVLDCVVSHGAALKATVPITKVDAAAPDGSVLLHQLMGLPATTVFDAVDKQLGADGANSVLIGLSVADADAPPPQPSSANPAISPPVTWVQRSADRRVPSSRPRSPSPQPHSSFPPCVVLGAARDLAATAAASVAAAAPDDDATSPADDASSPDAASPAAGQPVRLSAGDVGIHRGLERGASLQLLTCDAALADEDLLTCAARYAAALRMAPTEGEAHAGGAGEGHAEASNACTAAPVAGLVLGSVHRESLGYPPHGEEEALRLGLDSPHLPLASLSSIRQLAPLPPPQGSVRRPTFSHAHTCAAVLLRQRTGQPCQEPIVMRSDDSRASHGGSLTAEVASLLSRLASSHAEGSGHPPTAVTPPAAGAPPLPGRDEALPLAVLGGYVFPGHTSDFIIFEPRWRLLFRRVLACPSPMPFAIGPDRELGTTAELLSHVELPDGRLQVRVRGLRRFQASSTHVMPGSFGQWVASPSYLDDADAATPPERAEAAEAADAADAARPDASSSLLGDQALATLKEAAARHGWAIGAEGELGGGATPPPPAGECASDLSLWFAAVLPAPPDVKRRWFVGTDAAARLKDVDDWMRSELLSTSR